ncbi:hypothetical protein [Calothrix sp. FACHB-168]|nr:hypothetical protein [Calothrix sp. FACHB-168]
MKNYLVSVRRLLRSQLLLNVSPASAPIVAVWDLFFLQQKVSL